MSDVRGMIRVECYAGYRGSADPVPTSRMILGGKLDVLDEIQPIYDEIKEQYGTNEKPGL